MRTVLDEIMKESAGLNGCANGNCSCYNCQHTNKQQELEMIQEQLFELELNLEQEEELELSKIFARARDLIKKGYNKAKPVIVAADIIRRLVTPQVIPDQPPPRPVPADVARYYEEERQRKAQADIQQAQIDRRRRMTQKPDKESSVMQEILGEIGI